MRLLFFDPAGRQVGRPVPFKNGTYVELDPDIVAVRIDLEPPDPLSTPITIKGEMGSEPVLVTIERDDHEDPPGAWRPHKT